MPKRFLNNAVMAFGDLHYPYDHKNSFEFLADIKSTFNPDRLICTGDLLDIYSVSAYPKDPDHPDSWSDEIKKARKRIKKLAELFPDLQIMESNHDDRAYKKSRVSGIPREFLLPYSKVIGAPDTWSWHDDLTITVDATREQLFFAHTKTGGALTCAKDIGKTTTLGHTHSKFGATAFRSSRSKMIWGIDAGCLVSDSGSPYDYNKTDRGRPINGCVVIVEGIPIMVPMK